MQATVKSAIPPEPLRQPILRELWHLGLTNEIVRNSTIEVVVAPNEGVFLKIETFVGLGSKRRRFWVRGERDGGVATETRWLHIVDGTLILEEVAR